ncbi:MAG: hypothetical protein MR889_10980, partial [Clostridiales bacterium]|nr:hypothetical protein [Clostridiales bacterium]
LSIGKSHNLHFFFRKLAFRVPESVINISATTVKNPQKGAFAGIALLRLRFYPLKNLQEMTLITSICKNYESHPDIMPSHCTFQPVVDRHITK